MTGQKTTIHDWIKTVATVVGLCALIGGYFVDSRLRDSRAADNINKLAEKQEASATELTDLETDYKSLEDFVRAVDKAKERHSLQIEGLQKQRNDDRAENRRLFENINRKLDELIEYNMKRAELKRGPLAR